MSKRTSTVAGPLLCAVVCASGLSAQTPKNPISTKPEGTAPTCSYTGSVTDGKVSNSSACAPGTRPGTDPNQIAPIPASQRFPFPGEAPSLPGTPAPSTPAANGSGASSGSSAPSGNVPAAQRFPFPGEATPSDAAGAQPGSPAAPNAPGNPEQGAGQSSSSSPLRDAGSSGSSSSSSDSNAADQGYSSSKAGPDLPDDDPNAPMPTARRHLDKKKLPPAEKVQSNDEKEAEDVQVAGFYANDGNYLAAYQRAKEAVNLITDDPEAYLLLGESARKLGKLDEAQTNYKKVLALDPVPKTRKAAEKALKEMSGS